MKNRMVLGILIVYFLILTFVFCLQVFKRGDTVSSPTTSSDVAVEDRLDRAVVLYKESPIIMANKKQMLIDKNNASLVPLIENQVAYAPLSFFKSAYGASVTYDESSGSAAIRLDNEALVMDRKKADLVSSSSEKDIEYENTIFKKRNAIYVPLDVFAEAFDKEIHYYDDLVIVSGDKKAFTQEESADFINSLKAQVTNLPYVANESNLKELTDTLGRNGFLRRVGTVVGTRDRNKSDAVVKLITDEKSSLIVNDGKYIYFGRDNTIDVVDYLSNTAVNKIEMEKGFTISKLYLQNNTLVAAGTRLLDENTPSDVAGSVSEPTSSEEVASSTQEGEASDTMPEEGAANASERNNVCSVIYVYNIGDRANIVNEREFDVDGELVDTVKHGDYVYILSQLSVFDNARGGHFYPPSYRDSAMGGQTNTLGFENIQYFPETGSDDYTIISSLNIADISVGAKVKAYLCGGDNIYLSENNLYVAKSRYTAFDTNYNTENTYIYRMSLSGGNIVSSGGGNVRGYVLDRYSMNENSGYFSIATEYTERGTDKNITNIYILNNNMELCGEANRIADDAAIGSAIFTEDKIFLIPEEQGQAMYLIDSSNPINPEGKGILKLSTGNILIYPYDESHILTIDNGENILKLNAYSIEGMDNTVKLYSQELGGENISTALFENSDYFEFDKERNRFIIPVAIKDAASGDVTFNGSYVYDLNMDEGFKRIGTINESNNKDVHYFKHNGRIYCFGTERTDVVDVNDFGNVIGIEMK